jgi:hypothetical protein
MKRYIFCISILSLLFCAGCQKEEILTSKPGDLVAPVTDLKVAVAGDQVELTWKLPTAYPADLVKPVSVLVKITKDGQNAGTQVLDNNPERFTYSGYDASKSYRITVKVQGAVNTTDPGRSKLRISPGTTVAF